MKRAIRAADVAWFEHNVPDANGEVMRDDPDPDLVPYSVWKRARMERDCAIADHAKTHSVLIATRNEAHYWRIEHNISVSWRIETMAWRWISGALACSWLVAIAVRWIR